MKLGFIFALYAVCIICRAIIFNKRDIKAIWAFIPIMNKYKMGKMVGSKKLAIWNMIMHPLLIGTFTFCFGYELWIIKEFAYAIKIPVNGIDMSNIEVVVPDDIALIAIWSKYFLIVVAVVTLIVWLLMMWKFTIQHNRNPWWIMLWAIIPTIPYIVFAASSTVVIDGIKYTVEKVKMENVVKPENNQSIKFIKNKIRKKKSNE